MSLIKQNYGTLGEDKVTQQMIAPLQPDLTADRTYNKGQCFILDGVLYKATTTITSGEAITIGTNAVVTEDLSDQLYHVEKQLDYTSVKFTNDNISGDVYLRRTSNIIQVDAHTIAAGSYPCTITRTGLSYRHVPLAHLTNAQMDIILPHYAPHANLSNGTTISIAPAFVYNGTSISQSMWNYMVKNNNTWYLVNTYLMNTTGNNISVSATVTFYTGISIINGVIFESEI